MSGIHNPLEQFKITPIIPIEIAGVDISFTNTSLFMLLAALTVFLLLKMAIRKQALIPTKGQAAAESLYEFINQTLYENTGDAGRKYFPFIFALFLFIFACNLWGMVPYSFTPTSHIIMTFGLAVTVFIGVTIIGFMRHGLHFFSLFLPEGVPWWLAPVMIPIEIFAYLARPVSLSIRLAANMMAGHTIMKVVAGFVFALGILGGWLPLAFLIAFTGFEIFVAMLQAYIFTILTCVYLNDALNLH